MGIPGLIFVFKIITIYWDSNTANQISCRKESGSAFIPPLTWIMRRTTHFSGKVLKLNRSAHSPISFKRNSVARLQERQLTLNTKVSCISKLGKVGFCNNFTVHWLFI